MVRNGFFSLVILLSAAGTILLPHEASGSFRARVSWSVATDLAGVNGLGTQPTKKFGCLPDNIKPEGVVNYGSNAKENVTVKQTLTEMKARCRNGKLIDTKNREIRFFRFSCWGHPPPDYLEIQHQQREELEKLKKQHTVIVMNCNPRIM